jgi:putative acetyltransferase
MTSPRNTHGRHPRIEVRRERPGDEAAIRRVNDEAFGQPDEGRIVDAARAAGHSAVSLVAVDGPRIVGHILFTPVTIESQGRTAGAFGLGPMSVAPELQRQGIGSKLVEAGLRECTRLGCTAVVVVGHPEFYPRFGFRPGSLYGLRSQFDVPDEVFMVAELTPGVLAGMAGVVRYIPEFGD